MSVTQPAPRTAPLTLPAAAWVLAWSCVVGQVVTLVQQGVQDESAWPLSILLGAALVAFFSHGVLRARMVRFVIVFVLLTLGVLGELVAVVDGGGVGALLGLAVAAAQLGSLVWLSRTPWFAWQRTRPEEGPSLAPVMWLAVLVGVLGGLIGADTSEIAVRY